MSPRSLVCSLAVIAVTVCVASPLGALCLENTKVTSCYVTSALPTIYCQHGSCCWGICPGEWTTPYEEAKGLVIGHARGQVQVDAGCSTPYEFFIYSYHNEWDEGDEYWSGYDPAYATVEVIWKYPGEPPTTYSHDQQAPPYFDQCDQIRFINEILYWRAGPTYSLYTQNCCHYVYVQ